MRPPALAVGHRAAVWLSSDGQIEKLSLQEAASKAAEQRPFVVHMPSVANRLGMGPFPAFDLLSLYAFVRPARFCLPTPAGVAETMGLRRPKDLYEQVTILPEAARLLLAELSNSEADADLADLVGIMTEAGWPWSPAVSRALEATGAPATKATGRGFEIWRRLPVWREDAPEGEPSSNPVPADEARQRLSSMLGENAETRPQQSDYASACSAAFQPREDATAPDVVLAEAGTGVGKTLGYLAPASLWAERNGAPVWIATYTRNLQRQIDDELDKLFPISAEKQAHVVIRKGRENYLCLLNFDESARSVRRYPEDAVGLALMARWASASRDGDLVGGDMPGWLSDLASPRITIGLADRRGECIYAACTHYQKCFIERSVRRARRARLVVANHALVMAQAALGGLDDSHTPTRYIFDEGHHVFDAADSAFSAALTGLEAREFRRWLVGAEGRSGRARGLRSRLEEILPADPPEARSEAEECLEIILEGANSLPGDGWLLRVVEGRPVGALEGFLAAAYSQILARAVDKTSRYTLETEVRPALPEIINSAASLELAFGAMISPLQRLRFRLLGRLDLEADVLETQTRQRIEGIARTLLRRTNQLSSWLDMLTSLKSEALPEFVDWLQADQVDGQLRDVGMHRHWVDPSKPFAHAVLESAHGAVITSATLTDGGEDLEASWNAAEASTGAIHLSRPAIRARAASPYDYGQQARVFVVTDVNRNRPEDVAAAYRQLFLASEGGALGLFTAVNRLRETHSRMAGALEAEGLNLYSQHVDKMALADLIEIFRSEENSCLLGTDAVRDGVDVPGRSLRLIVFERAPWPRPDILHKARRAHFGGRKFDDRITRLRLTQAFGRLIRRFDDKGCYVILDGQTPSRLFHSFPNGASPIRLGLAEAVSEVRAFLKG
ncbi:MAG: ATP-dependent DNA helicase [Alphaproteobacteria bacterium]